MIANPPEGEAMLLSLPGSPDDIMGSYLAYDDHGSQHGYPLCGSMYSAAPACIWDEHTNDYCNNLGIAGLLTGCDDSDLSSAGTSPNDPTSFYLPPSSTGGVDVAAPASRQLPASWTAIMPIEPSFVPFMSGENWMGGADAFFPNGDDLHARTIGEGEVFRREVGSQAQSQASFKRRANTRGCNQPFGCTQCPKTFTRKKNLDDHFLRHLNAKDFKCPGRGCMSRFNTRSDLGRHLKTVHNIPRPRRQRND